MSEKAKREIDKLLGMIRDRHRVWLEAHDGYGKTFPRQKAAVDYSLMTLRIREYSEELFPSMTEACLAGIARVERILEEMKGLRDDKRRMEKEGVL